MWYLYIPLAIFVLSLIGIVFLVGRKLPALGQLPDLPAKPVFEKSADRGKKTQIIHLRFNRVWRENVGAVGSFFQPVVSGIHQLFIKAYHHIQNIEHHYHGKSAQPSRPDKENIQKAVWEAGELVNQGQLEQAEKKYMEVIKWDHRNSGAYKGLADLYWQQKDYVAAKSTYEHILKINRSDPEIYWQLGSLAWEQQQLDLALARFNRAYELAPNNPKYIDSLLEISLALGKKENLWKLAAKLREVNPENQKLADFEERIRAL
ncbi:tetratricopeptide repeat protein [Candidatus Uhrbacteria bacterium]|nr:tetratricopeptide repeat protein [Candidatus Uhrbacteria bacterium]